MSPVEHGYWPARLASLSAMTGADALAVVLVLREGDYVTYSEHNLVPAEGWQQTIGEGAVGRAVTQREPIGATVSTPLGDGRTATALVALPLIWNDKAIGALVGLRAYGGWAQTDVPRLIAAADLAALELAEANALWRAQRATADVESKLFAQDAIQREIHSEEDPDAIIDRATKRLAELFDADGVSLMVIDDAGELVVRSAVGMREEVVRQSRRRVGEGIAGWVAQHGQALLLSGKVEDPRFSGVDPSIGGALVAPLKSGDRILGVINVKARGDTERYGQAQLETLQSIARELGAVLARAETIRRAEDDTRQALLLYELSRLATIAGDPQADLEVAAAMLADALRHAVVGIWVAQPGDRKLRLRAQFGYSEVLPEEIGIEGDAVLQGAFVERRPQRVTQVVVQAGWQSPRASRYVLAPVMAHANAVGVLVVGRANPPYAESEVAFSATVAEYLGGLMQKTAAADVVQQTATAERRRIAQELHDGLAQELTGLVLALEGCQRALDRDPSVLPTQLAKAARDSRACLSDIRQYMTALRQHDTGVATLPVTMSRIVDDLRRQSGLAIELEEIGAERALSPQAERAVLRIAQEALHNVAQHAQGARARLVLHYHDDAIVVTIDDDGKGFMGEEVLRTAEERGRFGLLGMRERAEGVGGELTIRSEPGRGTVVQARIPYEASARGLTVVPPWPGSSKGQSEPGAVSREDEEDQRGGFLGRLFGRP